MKERGFLFLIGRLLSELRRFRLWTGIAVLLLLAGSSAALAANYLMGNFTDALLGGTPWSFQSLAILLGLTGFSVLFKVLGQYQWGCFFQRISRELRQKTVHKINRVRYSWLEAQTSGDLIVRLNADLGNLLAYYGQFRDIFAAFFAGILALGFLVCLNPLLALGYLFFPCLIQWCIYRWSKKMDPLFMKRQRYFGGLAASSQDFINSALEIKAMGLEKSFTARYRDKLQIFTDHLILLDKKSSKIDAAIETLGYLQTVLLLILGGFLVFSAKITLGDLLVCQLLSPSIGGAVKSLNFFQLRMNLASAFRVFELWDEKEDRVFRGKSPDNSITLSHVSFAYPQRPEVMVLRDICLTVKAGQKAAIVGPNGSGKSTIVKIIAGFYEPAGGSVTAPSGDSDGSGTAGTGIALVEQDTFLFSGSFAGNISLERSYVPDDPEQKRALIDAAQKAAIHDFIESTENGYMSDCGAAGARLSGGQRQRLAIARALYRNPGVILLDEPAGALDRKTADDMMTAVKTLFSGKTLILITHNISLIQDFDVIYLLDNGTIVDSGSHEDLLRNSLYSRLAREGRNEKVIS